MTGDSKAGLSILKEFTDSFVRGLPKTRVNTREHHIRLVHPNMIVQRRPYHLTAVERQVVRDRIEKKLKAKVVRFKIGDILLIKNFKKSNKV